MSEIKTQEEMYELVKLFFPEKKYKKIGTVKARKAFIGEKIITIINNEVETTNTIKEDSVVIIGSMKEEYAIPIKTFKEKYDVKVLTSEYQTYQARGVINAVEYKGSNLYFIASWGEIMLVKDGDMLNTTPKDIYRIEKEAFLKTYQVCS